MDSMCWVPRWVVFWVKRAFYTVERETALESRLDWGDEVGYL